MIAFNRAVKAGVMFRLEAQRKTHKGRCHDVTPTDGQDRSAGAAHECHTRCTSHEATSSGKAGSDRRAVKTTRLTLSGHRMSHWGAISVKISCAGRGRRGARIPRESLTRSADPQGTLVAVHLVSSQISCARSRAFCNGDVILSLAIEVERPVPIRQSVELGAARRNSTMSASVRECIYTMLPSGLCSADSVASRLGVDRRTVHRHLAREGKTFSAIMDSARAELVTRYIENRDRPLASVAELLGFSALSAFSRWFRSQFGCSVSEWRAGRPATRAKLVPAKSRAAAG
jgi:AraC-like DNA-binding protein